MIFFRTLKAILVLVVIYNLMPLVLAQMSEEEHLSHHPDLSGPTSPGPGNKGPGMSGGKGMGMSGDKGKGMMGGMKNRMGAQEPEELYPSLMALPEISSQQRSKLKKQAHERLLDGTALMSEGLGQLLNAAKRDDFVAMQDAAARLREGITRFETGLATWRAIEEGVPPSNEALQWFKRELNLLSPYIGEQRHGVLGMSWFHFFMCLILTAFFIVMVWMYFFKMRRTAALLGKLAAEVPSKEPAESTQTKSPTPKPDQQKVISHKNASTGERCDVPSAMDSGACPTMDVSMDNIEISEGLLPIIKRKLCKLQVARIYQETPEVKTFRLISCHGGALPFSYFTGQFLTVTLPVGDKKIRRSYTISSSPTQGYYCEITVKREEQGAASRYLHDIVKEGDYLVAQPPAGKFTFSGKEADSIVLIGGGVGITPMMDIARALTDMAWNGDIYFIVVCKDPEHFIYEAELKKMQQREQNLHLFVAMSKLQEDKDNYHRGRLTKELLAGWVPEITTRWISLCGSPPMMEATEQMLAELGVPLENIHTERFGSKQKSHVKAVELEVSDIATAAQKGAAVTFKTSEISTQLTLDETVLDASERVGVNIESSCRVGACGMCSIKLLSGQVTMEVEDGLAPDDKAAGMILACQARPKNDIEVEA